MIRRRKIAIFSALVAMGAITQGLRADTLTSEFTFQGQLKQAGSPYDGMADLDFSLWDADADGSQIGSTISLSDVAVSEGVFTVELDFGVVAFDGLQRWIKIDVNGTTLSPRQKVNGTPYSIQTRGLYVTDLGNVGIGTTTPGGKFGVIGDIRVSGKVQSSSGNLDISGGGSGVNVLLDEDGGSSDAFVIKDTGVERFRVDGNTGTVTAASFVGDGSGLTGIPGDDLGSHTATQALDMDSFDIADAGTVTATAFSGDGSALTDVPGDDLGDHTATQALNMNSFDINSAGAVTASAFSGDGSALTNVPGDDLGDHTATEALDMNSFDIENAGAVTASSYTGDGSALTNVPGDNLGNHILTQNLRTNGHYISGDGDDEGISVNADGLVGIGVGAGGSKLSVFSSETGPNAGGDNYVVNLRNTNTDATVEQGILWLEFQANLNNHANKGNYIQFSDGAGTSGCIENNDGGNVKYQTSGSDYAEDLERLDPDEQIENGDVVGVFGGRISKRTDDADWVMAISGNAAVVGNADYTPGREELRETVSFIGQVTVRVSGAVAIGDYIVASGLNDGSAIAVSPDDITPEQSHLIVGRAWEASADAKEKLVNTVVGLPEAHATTAALARMVREQKARIDQQQAQIDMLMKRMDALTASLASE